MDSHQESFVDSGVLSVLYAGLDAVIKCDILYSLLASRLMASSRFPDTADTAQWVDAFVHALERCAWTRRQERQLQPSFERQSGVTLDEVITEVLANLALHDHGELAREAFAGVARLPLDSPIRMQLRERQVSERTVSLPDGSEERHFSVHLVFAVSTRNARIDVFYLTFETAQHVEEDWLQTVFLTRRFTSAVQVKHHSFERAARAFASSRKQIVAFVGEHKMLAAGPGTELSTERWACGGVMAPDNPSRR
ncbi:hypothetical protein NTD84_29450 [Pseudomonas sp. 14P_8.1_Bac3]|uniref:hypothetical protein n=1 Tax=Pseudomonas sp. 14P_8.1_Bac3 TaxID=2971621 RepID=UPI0021CA8259|nr:hypothetical protein [Pseudomonas sp. 14P_8.1_Bac3]MCU1763827.1 hypothetical protein [Pseudomonas sp. 14P_8.1_Bac3]